MDRDWFSTSLKAARPAVIAALTRYFGDVDDAEDAFQEACLRAARTWERNGPPRDATAWLIFVGRNAALDQKRRQRNQVALPEDDALVDDGASEAELVERIDEAPYRDDILRLLFLCCHPSLSSPQQVVLCLKVIAGLSVDEIAAAFLVRPKAMEQRITRAKRRIAEAGASYELPSAEERLERLNAVRAAIYLIFNEGYSASGGDAQIRDGLCKEAIRLARLLLSMLPSDPETMGLLALCLLQHARRAARLNADGGIILLADQNRALWNRTMIGEGQVLVEKALRKREPGPLQVQAAIAAVHAGAPADDKTDWEEIARLYGILAELDPSPVVALNRAVAVAKVTGPARGLEMLQPLAEALDSYLFFHGARGALLAEAGRTEEAARALARALELARTPAEAVHIRERLDELNKSPGVVSD